MDNPRSAETVFVTGATGFVGRYVVRRLRENGHHVRALVRSETKARACWPGADDRPEVIRGSLFDGAPLLEGLTGCNAIVHLVGIIAEGPGQQTFDRIHRQGTIAVAGAAAEAGVRRFVHMSALGTRPSAVVQYHRTKWAAEEHLRDGELDWTIFRPSVIHGPDGEFMRLLRRLACDRFPPVMPYFGSGRSRVQPIDVRDVAYCFCEALRRPETIGQTYELGGPRAYTWRELYGVARRLIPGARRWKPRAGQPVFLARLLAASVMKTPLVPQDLKFNTDQVQMSQEDSICDHRQVEEAFGIDLRDFERELALYAADIR